MDYCRGAEGEKKGRMKRKIGKPLSTPLDGMRKVVLKAPQFPWEKGRGENKGKKGGTVLKRRNFPKSAISELGVCAEGTENGRHPRKKGVTLGGRRVELRGKIECRPIDHSNMRNSRQWFGIKRKNHQGTLKKEKGGGL